MMMWQLQEHMDWHKAINMPLINQKFRCTPLVRHFSHLPIHFSGLAPGNTLNSPCHGKHGEAHGTTAIATSIYTNMPCDNLRWIVTPSLLPQICIVLEVALLKFHTKFAPGWAHIWVNFDPIREIRPKVGGGVHFREWALFSKITV